MSEANELSVPAGDMTGVMALWQQVPLPVQTTSPPEGGAPTYWEVPADGAPELWHDWEKAEKEMKQKAEKEMKLAEHANAPITLRFLSTQLSKEGEEVDEVVKAFTNCFHKGSGDAARLRLDDDAYTNTVRFPTPAYVYPPALGERRLSLPVEVFDDDGNAVVLKNMSFFAHRTKDVSEPKADPRSRRLPHEEGPSITHHADIVSRVVMAARQAKEASIVELVNAQKVTAPAPVLPAAGDGAGAGGGDSSTAISTDTAAQAYKSLPWQLLVPLQQHAGKATSSPMHPAMPSKKLVMQTKFDKRPIQVMSLFLFPYGQLV